ncbi:MAG: beta-ketoacyl-ACP synthase III [Lachnospiraceae bacterium]
MRAKVIGTGHFVPELKIQNTDFEKFLDTSDEWIKERTCMEERRIAVSETALSMGAEAAERAIDMAGIDVAAIDIIICTTATGDNVYPNMSCLIQAELGNHTAMCFDLNAACSGFLFGASAAQAYISSGMAKTVLVVSTEIVSKTVDYTDRGSCILFGDGAAAVLFTASAEEGIVDGIFRSDGNRGGCITMKAAPVENHWTCSDGNNCCHENEKNPGFYNNQKSEENPKSEPYKEYMYMDGKAVYSFATRTVPEIVGELLDKNGETAENIDWFVFHQANGRMLEVIARKIGVSVSKVPMNLQKYGNTSSASIPLLLDEMVRDGRIQPGQKIILSGFGAGLTWGALLLEW